MAKISNTAAYPSISNLDSADYLVLTDAENELKTKTATIEQIQTLFGIDTLVAKVTVNTGSLLNLGDANLHSLRTSLENSKFFVKFNPLESNSS